MLKDETWRWRLVKRTKLRIHLFKKQAAICWWCAEEMSMDPFRITPRGREVHNQRYASLEHVIEKKNGGRLTLKNTVLSHAVCNRNRHKRKWPHDPVYGESVGVPQ